MPHPTTTHLTTPCGTWSRYISLDIQHLTTPTPWRIMTYHTTLDHTTPHATSLTKTQNTIQTQPVAMTFVISMPRLCRKLKFWFSSSAQVDWRTFWVGECLDFSTLCEAVNRLPGSKCRGIILRRGPSKTKPLPVLGWLSCSWTKTLKYRRSNLVANRPLAKLPEVLVKSSRPSRTRCVQHLWDTSLLPRSLLQIKQELENCIFNYI